MNTEIAPPSDSSVQAPLYDLLAPFTGYRYRFLLLLLKDPSRSTDDISRELSLEHQTVYNWRSLVPGFKAAMEAIKEGRADLRTEYAKLAFLEATPKIADAMVERAQGIGNAAQRAAERILETTGVLPKPGIEPSTPQVQVNTFTYYLVEPGKLPQPVMVETTAKEIPALPEAPKP